MFRHDGELDVDALAEPSPADLAAAIPGRALAEHAAQFLVVMALVDGTADEAKIAVVQEHAKALRVHDDAVRQLTELGRQNLQWVAADVARQNLRSITGHVVHSSIDDWILPYGGDHADPELTARYAAHDSTHVLSGYDTSPQGELLVSTFTAGMHPHEPMSGHILPVIITLAPRHRARRSSRARSTGRSTPRSSSSRGSAAARSPRTCSTTGWDFWAFRRPPARRAPRRVRGARLSTPSTPPAATSPTGTTRPHDLDVRMTPGVRTRTST